MHGRDMSQRAWVLVRGGTGIDEEGFMLGLWMGSYAATSFAKL